jgi:hypothetical protein
MAFRCSNGGEHSHETVAEARLCWGASQEPNNPAKVMDNLTGVPATVNPPSLKQVTYALDLLAHRVWPDEFTEDDLKAMERRQVSDLINGLLKAPAKNLEKGASGSKSSGKEFEDIPAGRYALAFEEKGNPEKVWRFYQVDDGKKNWTGIKFVKQLIGSPGAYREQRLSKDQAARMMRMIREVTPRQASINFGLKSKTCGVCSSPLSNQESLDLGIGPKCRNKMGW